MAEHPNEALAATITAARDRLIPQIRGLRALASIDTVSAELRAEANGEADDRQRRHDLLQAVLDRLEAVFQALLALEADGYPALPNEEISAELMDELRRQLAELEAAGSLFGTTARVSTLSFTFGAPRPKTDPSP